MKELGHQNRVLDYLKIDTDKGDGTGFEDTVSFFVKCFNRLYFQTATRCIRY